MRVLLLLTLMVLSQQLSAIQAFLGHGTFQKPDGTTYVESYIFIDGNTITYSKGEDGKYHGAIEVLLLFKKDTSIVMFDKYILNAPPVDDTLVISSHLIDLQRKEIEAGVYSLEATLTDKHRKHNRATLTNPVIVDDAKDRVAVADVVLLNSYEKSEAKTIFAKHGMDLVPGVLDWYPTGKKKLAFYTEIYNTPTALNDDFLVTYSIRKHSRKSLEMKNLEYGKVVNGLSRFSREKPKAVNVILGEFDISLVPSGNYFLYFEVRNRTNELVAKKQLFFQRSNKEVIDTSSLSVAENSFVSDFTLKEITYCLNCILPVASNQEGRFIDNLLEGGDTVKMKSFFYNFWQTRNPKDPYGEWTEYSKEVEKVNRHYSTRLYEGFQTDQGRVYLQYGPPDKIHKEDASPNSIPYQIWQYYSLPNGQMEVRFVFSNEDLVTNNYRLIHSNAQGEIYDPNWQDIVFYESEGDLQNQGFGRNRRGMDGRIEDF